MGLETKKLDLVQRLLNIKRESVLQKIEEVINENEPDWWNEIGSSEKEALEGGIQESDKTPGVQHIEVMAKYNKWL